MWKEWHELQKDERRSKGERLSIAYGANSPLSRELIQFLDALPDLTNAGALNGMLTVRGDLGALQQTDPGAVVLVMGMLSRQLRLSRQDLEAGLCLHPPAQQDDDALDKLLLATVSALAPEGKHGVLPLSRIVAEVNAGCGPHDGLSSRLIASRLRALSCVFTDHHPPSVIVIPRLLVPALPSPKALNTHENDSTTQTSP